MANCNYKVNIKDIQSKYSFKIFCSSDNAEIQAEIGNLEDLTTTAKNNLVSAINEVHSDTETNATAISGLQSGKEDKTNKVTSISSTSTDTQYPSAKAVYDSQETQNETISTLETNLEETQAELDYYKTIYNVLPKVEGNGESITLDNTGESILKLDLKGQCKQDSTTGKNLLYSTISSYTESGVTINKNVDGTISLSGTATADLFTKIGEANVTNDIQYYLSGCPSGGSSSTYRLYTSGSYGSAYDNGSGASFTATGTGTKEFRIAIYNGVNTNGIVFKPMLATTSGGEYEPYTGGQPSPSPDFPQQIHEVSGDNEINVVGRNRFDTNQEPNQATNITLTKLANGIRVAGDLAGTNYLACRYVLMDLTNYIGKEVRLKSNFVKSGSNTPTITLGICDVNGDNRTSKTQTTISGTTINFTVPELSGDVKYLYAVFYANAGGTANVGDYVDYTDIVLTIDNDDMTYEPYNGDTYEIDLRTSKNLFNKYGETLVDKTFGTTGAIIDSTSDSVLLDYIAVKPNTIYTLSGTNWARLHEYNESKVSIAHINPINVNSVTITTTSQTRYVRIGYVTTKKDTVQFEEGSSATSYVPYNSLKMRGIGTYEDYFVRNSDGQWCKYNAIGEVDLGTIDWTYQGGRFYTSAYEDYIVKNPDGLTIANVFCYKYTAISPATWYAKTTKGISIGITGYAGDSNILVYDSDYTSAASFKTAMSGNTLYFQRKTPYLSLIEDTTLISQLDKIEKALGKDGQTNISQSNNDVPFKIYASALKEIE